MTDDRWARIKSVVADAMDRPTAERAAFIEKTCRDDPRLQAAVVELLEHEGKADAYFDEPTVSLASQPDTTTVVRKIGRYETRRIIASGGMGTVYEAVQDHPHRLVAMKVLRRDVTSPHVMKRFRHEAEILGRLRHPNIAQIYDAGTFDEGEGAQPYFAMELVKGLPLIEYSDSKELGTRERFDLFVKVCDAVQYAHHSGIIHRDLKPDNIIVDDFGEPKILDFGVARATGSDIQITTLRTDIGQLIGTVPYMSPEQVTGDPTELDTRSDVYSLGVVLYELICGRLPHDLKDKNIPEAVRVIREDDPTPLSSINRIWRGDIETIVGKALEREKGRRYQSAAELAADIRRYLRDEPIAARPASTLYQLRKFARRNKALVTGASLAAAALILGTIVAAWKATEAGAEARKALAVTEFLGGMIGATNFVEAGQSLTVVDVLDRAVREIESAFPDQPETQAQIRHLLGLSYAAMSEFSKSLVQLRTARDIHRRILGPAHPDTLESAHDLGRVLWQNKQLEEAEEVMRTVVDRRQRTLGDEHPDTLWSLSRLGAILDHRGKLEESEAIGRRATDGLIRVLGEERERTLEARRRLAGAVYRNGKIGEAAQLYGRNLRISRRVLGEEHLLTFTCARELGAVLYIQGKWEEAEPLLRSSLEARRRLLGDDNHVSLHWMETFGWMLYRNGQREEGERLLRQGVEGHRRVLGERNLSTAYAMLRLANLERDLGNHQKAEEILRHCVDVQREVLGAHHRDTIENINLLSTWLKDRGPEKLAEAEALAREAASLARSALGGDD